MKKLKIVAGLLVLGLAVGGFGGVVAHASGTEQVQAQGLQDTDDLDLGELSEDEFLDLFEEMLKKTPPKVEIVDGVKTYKVSFEGLGL